MKILFDTNIILDFLLAREPFVAIAERILRMPFNLRVRWREVWMVL